MTIHVAPAKMTETEKATTMLDTLPLDAELSEGTPIGYCEDAGKRQPVCIPFKCRFRHVHLIGRAGTGKTALMEHMILDDVRRGVGLVVLDPYGDLCERLLCLIPTEAVERTIYLDPGDPDWIPLWNPFRRTSDESVGQVVDSLMNVFSAFLEGFGDRLEHILRNVLHAVLSLPGCTLFDVSNLLRSRSNESRLLIQRILDTTDDQFVRRFWEQDFREHHTHHFNLLQSKLGPLFANDSVSLMLSQPGNAFDPREILDEGRILLVNLSRIGPRVRGIVGSILLALLHQATLRRSVIPEAERKEAHLYCDEVQHFLTAPLVDLIAEARPFNVGLTLAHQYMAQFHRRMADPLSCVGSSIILRVDHADAEYLTKDLLGVVSDEDLITQPHFVAIARIGQRVVRMRTYCPAAIKGTGQRDQIIERSRRLYCKPTAEVVATIRQRRAEVV